MPLPVRTDKARRPTPGARLTRLALPVLVATWVLSGCAGYQSIDGPVSTSPGATTIGSESTTAEPSTTYRQIRQVYQRYQGTPYRYGGTSAQGFDCSGFILTVYREGLDRALPRTTGQMLAAGQFVRRDQLRPGDLVFFRFGGKEQHAGIYMGDGRFIHSSSSTGVTESTLDSRYWQNRYTQARRFL